MIRFLIMFLFFGLHVSLPARAQVLTDAALQQTILKATDNIYGYDFAEANQHIAQLRARYPQHPVGPLLKAVSLLWQYMPLADHKEATAQFAQAVEQSIGLSEKLLAKNKNDPEGVFFALTAHGYMALKHNNEKEQMKAVGESRRAYGYMKSGFKLMERNPEFYFTTGLYNYYIERYPMDHPIVKPFMFFFQDGSMPLGLQQMDIAAKRAIFTRVETCYYLANIYLKHENQPAKALGYLKFLTDKYPNNPLFQMRYAESLLLLGRYAEARPVMQRMGQFVGNRLMPLALRAFEGLLAERADHNDRAATEQYQAALKLKGSHAYTAEYQNVAYAGLARIAARAGQRDPAKNYYRKVLEKTEYIGLQREARAFLKE
jgi:tetratricopeptide (TPR) repeat protein